MAKKLNTYQIGLTADVSQAKSAINEVIADLNKLGSKPTMVTSLQEANSAALELARNLQTALNPNTGTLDLSKFNDNLAKGNMSLTDYAKSLSSIGSQGQEAFLKVASSIMSAETPLNRSNALLSEMWTTLKNTARWQFTSSALNTLVGSIESAYGYAQDLNKSLNDIRIVTGNSASEMATFADQANKAAKALSTTTTEYTNASLIYYQQGDSEADVEEKTAVTIKMANAAGESAETVSDQLTAVWNNFYDGSKSLEYYADVLVRLGADTASSTDEITEGMQQFAAVADTVGLSYEYAASALTTITATTRESANTVGNSLRTIFARLEGLKLGDTLDDGTTLNKYSAALQAVGVSIFDNNNELKDMDVLLEDVAAKWQTLAKDEQVALAQTVAGTQQYTRFVALMDNWDFMEENLASAYNSEGSLEEQAEIYAESWEAARDRVTAAWEDIYDSLINDNFFIGLDNALTPVLTGIADIIDGMGGMQGVLATASVLMNKVFGDQIAQTMRDMASNLGIIESKEAERARILKEEAVTQAQLIQQEQNGYDATQDPANYYNLETQKQLVTLQGQAAEKAATLTARQKELLQYDVDRVKNIAKQTEGYAKQATQLAEIIQNQEVTLNDRLTSDSYDTMNKLSEWYSANSGNADTGAYTAVSEAFHVYDNGADILSYLVSQFKEANVEQVKYNAVLAESKVHANKFDTATVELARSIGLIGDTKVVAESDFDDFLKDIDTKAKSAQKDVELLKEIILSLYEGTDKNVAELALGEMSKNVKSKTEIDVTAQKKAAEAQQKAAGALSNPELTKKSWDEMAVSIGTAIGQVTQITTGLEGLQNTLADFDFSDWNDWASLLSSIGLNILPGVVGLAKSLMTITGLAAPQVAVAMAAVAGVVGVIKLIDEAYVSADEAAEAASQAAEDLATAASNAKDKVSEVSEAFSDYTALVETLNSCTEGTDEWYTALEDVRSKIDEILTAYPQLLSMSNLFNEDGTLNDTALEDYQAQLSTISDTKSAASYMSQINAAQTSYNADLANAKNIYSNMADNGGSYNGRNVEADVEALYDWAKAAGTTNIVLSDFSDKNNGLVDSIEGVESTTKDYQNTLISLANSLLSLDSITDNAAQAAVSNWASAQEELEAGETQIVAAEYADAYNKYKEQIDQLSDMWSQAMTTMDFTQEGSTIQTTSDSAYNGLNLMQAYSLAEYGDQDYLQNKGNVIRGNDSNRSYVFQDSEGNSLDAVTAEYVESTVAAAMALEQLNNGAIDASETLGRINTWVDSLDIDAEGIQDYVANGNFNSMSQEDFNLFKESILGDNGEVDEGKLATVFGENWQDIVGSAEEVQRDLELHDQALSSALEDSYQLVNDTVDKLYNGEGELGGADVNTVNAVSDFLEQALVDGGTQGLAAAEDVISSLDSDSISGNLSSFIDTFNSMDWETQDVSDFEQALADAGIETNLTTAQLEALIAALSQTEATTSGVVSKYQEAWSVISDLEDGDSISAEDYGNLLDEQKAYFQLTGEGTYELVGKAEDLVAITKQLENTDLAEVISSNQEKSSDLSGYTEASVDVLQENAGESLARARSRLILLERMGYEDAAQLLEWTNELDAGGTDLDFEALTAAVNETAGSLEQVTEKQAEYDAESEAAQKVIANSCDSVEDLSNYVNNGIISSTDVIKERLEELSSYEKVAERASNLLSLARDTELGDTISEDEYNTLTDEAQQYFTKMLDGTYKLTSDAEEFYNLVMQQAVDEILQYTDQLTAQSVSAGTGATASSGLEDLLGGEEVPLLSELAHLDLESVKEQLTEVIDGLSTMDECTEDQIANWQTMVDSANGFGEVSVVWSDISETLGENVSVTETLTAQQEVLKGKVTEAQLSLLSEAESFDELSSMADDFGESLDAQAYNTALNDLYETLDTADLDTDEWEDYAKYLQKIAKQSDKLDDSLADNEDAAKDVAKSIMKMNSGLEDLADGFEDWNDVLSKSSKESQEYCDAMSGMRDALANVLDISGEFISDDFIADNLDLIKQAATGSATAIDNLKAKLVDSIVANIVVNNELENYDLAGAVSNLQSMLDAMGPLEVGATIDDQSFIDTCNEIIKNAGLTADQANALFDAMGFETTFKTEEVPVERTGHTTITTTTVDEWGEAEMADGSIQRYPAVMTTSTSQGDPYTYTEYVDAIAMESSEDGTETPVITGLTKKATGASSNYSSSNSGGSSLGSSGSSGGGSSGGSSEGFTPEKQEVKESDFVDRYHEVDDEIDDVTRAINKLKTATDRAFGKQHLNNLDQEIAKLKEQVKLIKQKTAEAENYLKFDQTNLEVAFDELKKNLGLDANLTLDIDDESHNITNIETVERAIYEKIQAIADHLLTLTNEDDYNTYKEDTYEQAMSDWETFKALIEQFEETRETIQDLGEDEISVLQEIADAELEKITYKLEITLTAKEMKDAVRQLKKEVGEMFGDALTQWNSDWESKRGERPADLAMEQAQAEADMYDTYLSTYNELVDLYNSTDPNVDRSAIIDEIESLQGEVLDSAEAIAEWVDSIEDLIPDAVSAAAERMDAFTDQLEHNTAVLDTIKELYALQGVTYRTMEGYNALQTVTSETMEAQIAKAKIERAQYQDYAELLANAQERLDAFIAAGGSDSDIQYDTLKESRDAYLEQYNEAQEAYLEAAQEAMTSLQEYYETALERAAASFGQIITDGLSLDVMQDKFDHYIDNEENYLDAVNTAYEKASWYNKLQADIDDTTNKAYAAKLKALQEEIDLRAEGNTLTEYDLDILNAKYEVLKAQAELEDAQNAKNQLQLVRDSQGNWNYQYSSNPDDVQAAEQNLLDAQNEYYNIAKQQTQDLASEILTTQQEFTEAIQEIYQNAKDGVYATDEEFQEALDDATEYYTEKMEYLYDEQQVAMEDMTEAGSETIEDFENVYADTLADMTGDIDDWNVASKQYLDDCAAAWADYSTNLADIAVETGTTMEDLAAEIDTVSESTDRLETEGLETEEQLNALIWTVDDAAIAMSEYAVEIWAAYDALVALAEEMAAFVEGQADLSDVESAVEAYDASKDYSALMNQVAQSQGVDSELYQLYKKYRTQKVNSGYDDYGWTTEEVDQMLQNGYTLEGMGVSYYSQISEADKKKILAGTYDTGGYTGEWTNGDEDGRLAFLHQKELVLNAEDTENILAAVEAVRSLTPSLVTDIEKSLDNGVLAAVASLSEALSASNLGSPQTQQLEQDVHIEANFPNVTSSNEIEEALTNLVNDAAQWVRRS